MRPMPGLTRNHLRCGTALALLALSLPAQAQTAPDAGGGAPAVNIAPLVQKYALPQTTESISAQQVEETINAVDPEDAIKYLPSVFVRKRNYGDTQPTLETRTWGVNSSARSLVYVDDVPISALVANNNTIGAPRWGMVSLEQLEGADMLYGPFSAAYPGNSMGGVLLLTTRMPEGPVVTGKQTVAMQEFDYYKTNKDFVTSQTSATVGDKIGRTSVLLSFNNEDSYSNPIAFITNGSIPAGTTGAIFARNKTGAVADVVGAGGLLHTLMNTLNAKVTVDVTDWLKASYGVGYWSNDTTSSTQTYLRDANGNPTYGGVSGFASNTYTLAEQHLMNSFALKTDTHENWDWEFVTTRYDFLQDIQNTPSGVGTGTTLKTTGYVARLDGTNWETYDIKGIWRPDGPGGAHEVSVGLHDDHYRLNNPTYNTSNWQSGPASGNGTLYTSGRGDTETMAVWAQDAWKFAPAWRLTTGLRLEQWRAYDGYNLAGGSSTSAGTSYYQPTEKAANASPKVSLSWQIAPSWNTSLSFGQAARYPTVSELYQIVSTGSVYAQPNPNLKPETVQSWEWAIEHREGDFRGRVSVFEEDTTNALVQQTSPINGVDTSNWQNVGQTRNRGVELVLEERNVIIPGLDITNSTTYVDSRIVSDPTFQSTTGTTATGKRVPYVPDWRDTLTVSYRPDDRLTYFAALRYQGKMYSTLDNTDSVGRVMGSFDRFAVVDTHVHYQVTDAVTMDAGIDNLFNYKYFEYHPFPGRTYVASAKVRF